MMKGDQFFREIDENCYRPEARLKECDRYGVDVQVLSTVPVMFSYWAKPEDTLAVSRFLNDHIAAICKKYPKRFVGLGTIPMQAPDLAIQELRRCIQELGLVGIQIGSHVNKWPLSAPELFPIFQEAERLGACIFVHPWDMLGQEVMGKYWLPWLVGMPMETSFAICSLLFGGVFDRLPNLRWCFAHGGGAFPGTIGRIEHGWKVRPDLCAIDCKGNPRSYLSRFWVDSLVHDKVALKHLLDLMGKDKVVLGTDYPFPLGEEVPGALVESIEVLNEEEKAAILWNNGLAWLGLKEDRFIEPDEHQEQANQGDAAVSSLSEQIMGFNLSTGDAADVSGRP